MLKQINVYSVKTDNIPYKLKYADMMNGYFVDVVERQGCKVNADAIIKYNSKVLQVGSEEAVVNPVSRIKSNISGSDNISLQMLKLCCSFI